MILEYFLLPNINKRLSKLIAGAAEIGQNYGLYTLRKPSREESITKLSYALEKGIDVF
jgi:signal transduction histidine kinase